MPNSVEKSFVKRYTVDSEVNMSDFKSVLSQKRKEKGLSQSELAKQLHVTKQTVSKWETGKGMPDISILTSIAEIFDVTVDELLTGNEPPARIEIVEREVEKKPSVRKLIAIIAPVVIVLIVAVTLMSVYIPKAINKTPAPAPQQPEPVYQEMDIVGNRAIFDGSLGSDIYCPIFDERGVNAYYKFTAEFNSIYYFYITMAEMSKLYINESEYTYPPIKEDANGNRWRELNLKQWLNVGDEVRLRIYGADSFQRVSVKMQDNFNEISIAPHSEFAIALNATDMTPVRYIMNPDNFKWSAEALEFDRLVKLKYIDRTGKREYETIWRADDKESTGSRKVFEAVLQSCEYHVYEGFANILIIRNPSDKHISIEDYIPGLTHRIAIQDEIEEIELDRVYEFGFDDDTRFKYYKLNVTHQWYKRFDICYDRFSYGIIYEYWNFEPIIRSDWGNPQDRQVTKDGILFFAQPFNLMGADYTAGPHTYYIKVEKLSGAEKGRFYITASDF